MAMRMTDHDAFWGQFRPKKCEWISPTDDNERCDHEPLRGKSYCDKHYQVVFDVVSLDNFEELTKKDLEESEKLNDIMGGLQ